MGFFQGGDGIVIEAAAAARLPHDLGAYAGRCDQFRVEPGADFLLRRTGLPGRLGNLFGIKPGQRIVDTAQLGDFVLGDRIVVVDLFPQAKTDHLQLNGLYITPQLRLRLPGPIRALDPHTA